ncbi:hypothetical protein MesoLjLa_47500 [Mesorhizobium sp. L-2-11]|nr:hypothetical protein MesoLjLa_47500 [Mesorhizobium sp. L-2-11]
MIEAVSRSNPDPIMSLTRLHSLDQREISMSESKTTTNHDDIRQWAEDRGGRPAVVRTKGEGGILRIDFGEPEEEFEAIEWDEFFRIFDENNLAFLYQDETGGGKASRFNKFVDRNQKS